jgi:hypothetical protein
MNKIKSNKYNPFIISWLTGDISLSSDYADKLVERINNSIKLLELVKISNFSHYEEVFYNLEMIRNDLYNILTTKNKYKSENKELKLEEFSNDFVKIIDRTIYKLNKRVVIYYWYVNQNYQTKRNNTMRDEILQLFNEINKKDE